MFRFKTTESLRIGHFRVTKTLTFKTSAKPFFLCMKAKKTHFHINGFTLSLALKLAWGNPETAYCLSCEHVKCEGIGHFRVPPDLFFKTRVGAQPLIWKSFFFLMQIKLILTRKVVHLASFGRRRFLELGSGLLRGRRARAREDGIWEWTAGAWTKTIIWISVFFLETRKSKQAVVIKVKKSLSMLTQCGHFPQKYAVGPAIKESNKIGYWAIQSDGQD